ncbi:MAG: hypothetical protein AMXMBFR81_19780 [Chthonomonas sp.]
MTLSTRFGLVEYNEEDILTFPQGLMGLPAMKRFLILEHKPGSPFRWLQSLDEPSMSLLVCDPWAYVADYDPQLRASDETDLALTDSEARMILATASIPPGKPEGMTLNLLGPLVINLSKRIGKQIALDGGTYTIRHRVFQRSRSEAVAA